MENEQIVVTEDIVMPSKSNAATIAIVTAVSVAAGYGLYKIGKRIYNKIKARNNAKADDVIEVDEVEVSEDETEDME